LLIFSFFPLCTCEPSPVYLAITPVRTSSLTQRLSPQLHYNTSFPPNQSHQPYWLTPRYWDFSPPSPVPIQSVSRLVDITAGGDFLGLCVQQSSYKHVSNFGRLRSYGHFLIPVHTLVCTASYGTSWRVMYSTWWLIVCVASIIFATWLAHPATDSPVSVSRHLEGI